MAAASADDVPSDGGAELSLYLSVQGIVHCSEDCHGMKDSFPLKDYKLWTCKNFCSTCFGHRRSIGSSAELKLAVAEAVHIRSKRAMVAVLWTAVSKLLICPMISERPLGKFRKKGAGTCLG